MHVPSWGPGREEGAPGKGLSWSQASLAQPGLSPCYGWAGAGLGAGGRMKAALLCLLPMHGDEVFHPDGVGKMLRGCGLASQLATGSGLVQQGSRVWETPWG